MDPEKMVEEFNNTPSLEFLKSTLIAKREELNDKRLALIDEHNRYINNEKERSNFLSNQSQTLYSSENYPQALNRLREEVELMKRGLADSVEDMRVALGESIDSFLKVLDEKQTSVYKSFEHQLSKEAEEFKLAANREKTDIANEALIAHEKSLVAYIAHDALIAHEKALVAREEALNAREKALVAREKALIVRDKPRQEKSNSKHQRFDVNPNSNAIYVGNLSEEVTTDMLLETFSFYPSVGSATLHKSETGRCYGFVNFGDEDELECAMTEMDGITCLDRPMKLGRKSNQNQKTQFHDIIQGKEEKGVDSKKETKIKAKEEKGMDSKEERKVKIANDLANIMAAKTLEWYEGLSSDQKSQRKKDLKDWKALTNKEKSRRIHEYAKRFETSVNQFPSVILIFEELDGANWAG